jgi:hypothetical protein
MKITFVEFLMLIGLAILFSFIVVFAIDVIRRNPGQNTIGLPPYYKVVEIDGHEYLIYECHYQFGITHKADCHCHAQEKQQKEQQE